jgi:hypothetical protein
MILHEDEVRRRVDRQGGSAGERDEDLIGVIWPAVEAQIRVETGRLFEAADYDVRLDAPHGCRKLLLPAFPVRTLTSLEWITDVDENGTATLEAYDAGDYELDARAGIVKMRAGFFPAGVGRIRAVFRAGYEESELRDPSTVGAAAPTPDDLNARSHIYMLKSLVLKIVAREYAIEKDTKRHLRSHSYGDESSTYNFDLTFDERRMLALLGRGA